MGSLSPGEAIDDLVIHRFSQWLVETYDLTNLNAHYVIASPHYNGTDAGLLGNSSEGADVILFPREFGGHWVLFVLHMAQGGVQIYDSLGRWNPAMRDRELRLLRELWFVHFGLLAVATTIVPCPQQANFSNDCGLFLCRFMAWVVGAPGWMRLSRESLAKIAVEIRAKLDADFAAARAATAATGQKKDDETETEKEDSHEEV